MKHLKSVVLLLVVAAVSAACGGGDALHEESEWTIDPPSYSLGGIGAFAEMVGAGVKKLALSGALDPADMDVIYEDAVRIAAENGAEIFRETDFLVTDLFPASITDGKHVLLISSAATREEYMNLKETMRQLEESGQYEGAAREDIARRMGGLLSYSDEKINSLLAARSES